MASVNNLKPLKARADDGKLNLSTINDLCKSFVPSLLFFIIPPYTRPFCVRFPKDTKSFSSPDLSVLLSRRDLETRK